MRALNVGSLQMMKKKDIPPVPVSGSAENIKSTRFENQKAMVITSIKKRTENIKSAEEKTTDISKESVEDVNNEMREVGGRKRKRFNVIRFQALFKPQEVQVESVR
nr:hypothetical protein [Tanacetum cinerariifolium]